MNAQRALRGAGIDSEIYYGSCTPDMVSAGRPISALGWRTAKRHLLYQASIGSPVFDALLARRDPKIINYHNITPARLLAPWEPAVADETALGRSQLTRLAPECELAIAVSHFNEEELREVGYRKTTVVPLLIDVTSAGADPDPDLTERLLGQKAAGGVDLLYVGKLSPHKAPHDLVKMLFAYRRVYDPHARLHLIGSPLGETYGPALMAFIRDLGLEDAVEVAGSLPSRALEAYWRAADVYVSASDHEGFCAPLIEAMGHGVPVVAYGVAAVPETVEGAGIALPSKEPLRFAAAVARIIEDAQLRTYLVEAGRRRIAEFSLVRSMAHFVDVVRDAAA